jgi:eukaryotic-like serine/threonine-protein kinase
VSRGLLGGRFVLTREIGSGGMSVVFLGKDEVLDRPVALKVLRDDFERGEVSSRFRREGRTAARLSHPNIVQVYDAGEDELDDREVSYIVMEYVPGGDLKDLVDEKGPLEEKELARIGADVASGLAHAHGKGIIHRDIKPRNILIDDYDRPKLADFGVARALNETKTTETGSYLGTASYSSPEQLRGEEITPKSDVYSLGCTLYEAAVGEPPFSGAPIAAANQQLTKPPIPPRARGVALSKPFEALILSCLAKDPADRPDATGLQERLLRLSAVTSGALSTASTVGETARLLAEAAQEIGTAGAANAARGLGAVARGLRNRASLAGDRERTLATPERVPYRTFRQRRKRRAALVAMSVAALVALLLLGLVAVLPALLGSGTKEEAAQVADGAQDAIVEPPAETTAAEVTAAPVVSRPAPPPSVAEEAVYDMYVKESYRDRDASWAYLSQREQNEVGSREQWAKQERLDTFLNVYFVQMPNAEVSGNTAEVGFKVRETRTGEVSLLTGTWECVNEGGEWKLDRLMNQQVQAL